MSELQVTNYLAKLFEQHGFECLVDREWVVPNSEPLILRGSWFPAQNSGALSIQVLGEGVVIEECFAGLGEGESAVGDALTNFTLNSFHVLLAALWGKNDPDQVTTENWMVRNKPYTAYIGGFGMRNTEGVTAYIPPTLFSTIAETIKREPLENDVHWFRFFFCNLANNFDFEALKDNEEWEPGLDCLKSSSWERKDGYYSVRLFLMLRAA